MNPNPIVPLPPTAPRITSKAPSVLPGSFAPAAFTARPAESPSLAPRADRPPPPRTDIRRFVAFAALVVLGAVTVRVATRAVPPSHGIVSGRAGLKHTKKGSVERWFRQRVTLTIDGSFAKLAPSAGDAVEEAFGAWLSSDAKLPRLAFDSRATHAEPVLAPDGENRIYYAPIRLPGHEGDLAITLGYTNDATGEIVEADVIVNSLRPFALLEGAGCTDKYDLRSVVTHEAGHFFGLGEDMTDGSATMFYSTKPCDLGKRDLKSEDASQVSSLYVAKDDSGESDGADAQKCSVGTVGGSTGDSSSAPLVALGFVTVATARRRRSSG